MTLLEGSYNQVYEWECTTGGFMTVIGVDGHTQVSVWGKALHLPMTWLLLVLSLIVHTSLVEHLLQICKYWDKLGPIMQPEEGEDH
jgi:hypothetical protein